MPRISYSAEQIIKMLRTAEVELAKDLTVNQVCRTLNREIFETLLEAKTLVGWWKREYNGIRPHRSLGYRPPAPETLKGKSLGIVLSY